MHFQILKNIRLGIKRKISCMVFRITARKSMLLVYVLKVLSIDSDMRKVSDVINSRFFDFYLSNSIFILI